MRNRMGRKLFLLAGTALFLFPACVLALQDGAARTPPMGFSTWNFFGCNNINEANVFNVAKSLLLVHPANWEGKQTCLRDVGYVYINLDDCWHSTRAADGTPQWNTTKFPDGFPWLVDTLHKMGLKIGMYSDCGSQTCAGYFGTWGHDSTDACTYRKWGFDYLKFDWCAVASAQCNQHGCDSLYSQMGHWLVKADSLAYLKDTTTNKQHHRLVFSLCQWGDFNVATWADSCGHLWRTTGDIRATWNNSGGSVYTNWNSNLGNAAYAKPGAWNDPDMLEIGNSGLSDIQNQAHMDLWCISAAPLLMGNNTTTMTEVTFSTLSNREVIAVDQDSLGYQGTRVRTVGNVQIISKKLKVRAADTVNNRKWAVVILNNGTSAIAGSIKWSDIFETNTKAAYRVRNLWMHRWLKSGSITDTATPPDTMETVTDSLTVASLPATSTMHVLMIKGHPDSISVTGVRPQDNNEVAAQLGSRMSVRGSEVFIPLARSTVQVFDMQGRQIASVSASQPGWYSFAGRGVLHGGTYLVRLNTPAGSISRVMAFVK